VLATKPGIPIAAAAFPTQANEVGPHLTAKRSKRRTLLLYEPMHPSINPLPRLNNNLAFHHPGKLLVKGTWQKMFKKKKKEDDSPNKRDYM
jgi:hypothetical protein